MWIGESGLSSILLNYLSVAAARLKLVGLSVPDTILMASFSRVSTMKLCGLGAHNRAQYFTVEYTRVKVDGLMTSAMTPHVVPASLLIIFILDCCIGCYVLMG